MTFIKALALVLILWPAIAFAEDQSVVATKIEQILAQAGAPEPLTIVFPEGRSFELSSMEVFNVTAARETVWVRIRCHLRRKCHEVIATLRFTNAEDAQSAQTVLAGSTRTQSKRGPLTVHAGTPVILLLENEKMRLRLSAVALNSGSVGERIRVRDRETRKIHCGVISAPGVVREQL